MKRRKKAAQARSGEDFGPAVVGGVGLAARLAAGALVMGVAEQSEGGIVTARHVRAVHECMLDLLLRAGALGAPGSDEARRRFEAGLWLRELYLEKARLGSGMSCRFDAFGGRGDGADRIPDDVAWNIKCVQDTMRACAPYGPLLTALCCHDDDRYPWRGIDRALTRLADHRGL